MLFLVVAFVAVPEVAVASAVLVPVVPVVLAASPVDGVAAGLVAVALLSASGDRVVVEKSICMMSVRVSGGVVTE